MRNLGALFAGLLAGMAFNMALVMLNAYVLFPMPDGLDMNDPPQMNAYLETLPAVAFVVVLLAHLGQSFIGAWVAARLCRSRPMLWALIIGALSLVGGVLNALQLTAPTWLYVEFPLYLLVAWAAGRLARSKGSAGEESSRSPTPS